MGWIESSKKVYIEILMPSASEWSLFGNSVLEDIISLDEVILE